MNRDREGTVQLSSLVPTNLDKQLFLSTLYLIFTTQAVLMKMSLVHYTDRFRLAQLFKQCLIYLLTKQATLMRMSMV
jgi:hypothetical protein